MTKLLKRRDVCAQTGLSLPIVYKLMREGRFPRPIAISTNRVAWVDAEIEAWVKARQAERDRMAERGEKSERGRRPATIAA